MYNEKKTIHILLFLTVVLTVFLLPNTAFAQISASDLFDPDYGHVDFAPADNDFLGLAYAADFGLPGSDGDAFGGLGIQEVLVNILRYILSFMGIIAVSMILLAGFKFLVSSGNEESLKDAKRTLVSGVIGLVIIFTSYTLVGTVVGAIEKLAQGGPL